MEKCYIPQNTYCLSREEIHEHTVTPKVFSLMMLRGLKVGAAVSWIAQHRPSNSRILFQPQIYIWISHSPISISFWTVSLNCQQII